MDPTGHQQLKLVLWPLLNPKDSGPLFRSGSYDYPVHALVLQQLTLTTSMACPCTGQDTTNSHSHSSTKSKQCPWIVFGYPGFPVGPKKPLKMIPACGMHVKPLDKGVPAHSSGIQRPTHKMRITHNHKMKLQSGDIGGG